MTQSSGVFLLQGEHSLVPMEPGQFATEDDFQRLLSRFPELLVGDQIDPESPRRWVLVKREQPISTGELGASLWSIDHVFLDQDGIPTLVEIKRQSDSRLRREVVGQMLDYAANCITYWSLETLQSGFEKTCQELGRSSDVALRELLGADGDVSQFWDRVRTNLHAKKIRLLFVADVIPIELRRIVEFLNEQMDPVEVLAIELRQFASKDLKTIVPTVYGQTQATARKRASPAQRWDEASLFEKLSRTVGERELAIARSIYNWMGKSASRQLIFGTGKENGSVYPAFRPSGTPINPAYLSSDGKLWIQFGALEGKPVFGPIETRRALMEHFNEIRGANLREADLTKYPSIPLRTIAADPEGETKVISALKWMEERIDHA
ncbi:hypothetical protein [Bradyrhizobium sp. 151]|uniref:hypothetical protein n=1 Tax=Bradyrhizobium sp. 151 TaxID=2782626 RepID=UPI001FFABE72|nr:hypothetical protein [Bradyrhizobium sp. 151]MCK1656738.1 hypothetical protein [Bradyrhizobium sp. 151]